MMSRLPPFQVDRGHHRITIGYYPLLFQLVLRKGKCDDLLLLEDIHVNKYEL